MSQEKNSTKETAGEQTHISHHRINLVRQLGTEEQIRELEEALLQAGQEQEEEQSEFAKNYRPHDHKETTRSNTDHIVGLVTFMSNRRRFKSQRRPAEITEKMTRRLLWEAYCQIVYEETKINIYDRMQQGKEDAISDSQKEGIKNMAKWIIGEAGPWDPNKSLYLWGEKGTGKTTLLRAAHAVLGYYDRAFNWTGRQFEMQSLYQTFLDIYTSQDLNSMRSTARGWWALDDLRPEHAQYKHFGNEIPVLAMIFISRHDAWKLHGEQTILVGNIHPQDFKDLPHIEYDKMMQQYLTVEFTGPNYRKPKARL